jgi:hypothetical protein
MATSAEIQELRLRIGEPTSEMYSDATLSDRIDAAENVTLLAAQIWSEKAAKYAAMVDMQEGTSRRSLSQLQEQALKMSTALSAEAGGSGGVSGVRRTTTRAIERV